MATRSSLKAISATDATPWKPLGSDQFRVLRVFDVYPQIYGVLEVQTFGIGQRYDALSYAWEGQRPSVDVMIGKIPMKLTQTVHQAITALHLRYTGRFFIDSICINQSDEKEKAQQVSVMHKVYRNAERTIAWLGPEENDSALAFDYMNSMRDAKLNPLVTSTLATAGAIVYAAGLTDFTNDLVSAFAHLAQRAWMKRLWVVQEVVLAQGAIIICGDKSIDFNVFLGFCMVLYRVNFPKLVREMLNWPVEDCLQLDLYQMFSISEAVRTVRHNRYNSKDSPGGVLSQFMTTSHYKRLHTTQKLALEQLTKNPDIEDAEDWDQKMLREIGRLTPDRKIRHMLSSGWKKLSGRESSYKPKEVVLRDSIPMFLDMVERCRAQVASEPVDHIYGLVGFLEKKSPYKGKIVVDYSAQTLASPIDLFKSFAGIVLTVEPELRLLSSTSSRERLEGLPSWCPNFACPRETEPITHRYAAGRPTVDHSSPNCSIAHPHFEGNDGHNGVQMHGSNVLSVWGAQLDIIKKVGSPSFCDIGSGLFSISDDQSLIQDNVALMTWFGECSSWAQELSGEDEDEDIYESFWRTMVGDIDYTTDSIPAGDQVYEETDLALNYIFKVLPEFLRYTGDDAESDCPAIMQKHLGSFENPIKRISAYIDHLRSFWKGRRLFITEGGRAGFASQRIREGDQICMFYTGPSLYVIRENVEQGFYEFIDDAFVGDLMQGQAFELLDEGSVSERQFLLK